MCADVYELQQHIHTLQFLVIRSSKVLLAQLRIQNVRKFPSRMISFTVSAINGSLCNSLQR